ncbi:MAG: Ig-like domain-containing protein [Bacilli bacterium]|nr:Ig-like domain-containing protein [Bacilli bacterium]
MKINKFLSLILTSILGLAFLVACNNSPTPSNKVESVEIQVNNEKITSYTVNVKSTFQFSSKAFPSAANQKVRWWISSSDSKIASIDQTGLLTANKIGNIFVGISSLENEMITYTIPVSIDEAFFLDKTNLDLEVDSTYKLIPSKTDNIIWSSSDSNIASVDQTGLVTAIKKGNAVIKAKRGDQIAQCAVSTYNKGEKTGLVTLDWDSTSLEIDEIKNIPYHSDVIVTFKSSDPSVVSINNDGQIKGLKPGSVVIEASTSKNTDSLSVVVTKSKATQILKDDIYYLAGYGNFQNGGNYSLVSINQFIKEIPAKDDYFYSYSLKNKHFEIGDSFRIYNVDKSFILLDSIITTGPFTDNDIYRDIQPTYCDFDIVSSGIYSFYLSIDKHNHPIFEAELVEKDAISPKPSSATFDLYSFSDFHGNIEDVTSVEPGIDKYSTYIKKQINESSNDTILINGGDLWQGSYYSNFNYGQLLNECMNEINIDAFALGNHEFDWGQEKIAANQAAANFPYLGANIVYLNNDQIVDYVQPYKITVKNGVKIGIIGVIGSGQITSITSTRVDDIAFKDDLSTIKRYSDKLRNVFKCDIVIASDHEGTKASGTSFLKEITNVSPESGRRYVDAIIFGHNHISASGIYNGVGYINSGSNGERLSHMTLQINSNTVTTTLSSNIGYRIINNCEKDPRITEIIDKFVKQEHKDRAYATAGYLSETFEQDSLAANMMAKAIFERAKLLGYNLRAAMVNTGRQDLPAGEVTYYDLNTTFPFFNSIIIFRAKGSDMLSKNWLNNYSDKPFTVDRNQYYLIATYDYLAFHKNESRNYNYFGNSDLANYESINEYPFDIIFDYMCSIKTTIQSSDYTGSNFNFI